MLYVALKLVTTLLVNSLEINKISQIKMVEVSLKTVVKLLRFLQKVGGSLDSVIIITSL